MFKEWKVNESSLCMKWIAIIVVPLVKIIAWKYRKKFIIS